MKIIAPRNALQPERKILWYEIKKVLGHGSFGITYLAFDHNLNQEVAIKEYLPLELAVREGDTSIHPASEEHNHRYRWGLKRFLSEGRTLAQFNHANIVQVHSLFELNNSAYLVMEYEKGVSLREIMESGTLFDTAELLNILLPLLEGLEKIHARGFLHRDIKPANILIRQDGSPVLLDFGSARQMVGDHTRTLTSVVSPGYAPYEQYSSTRDEQGPWTDIYGLGATLYRTICGVPPINAVERAKAILQAGEDSFISASELAKGRCPESLLNAIDHALAFKPQDRPQNVAEWRKEFEAPERIDDLTVRLDGSVTLAQSAPTLRIEPFDTDKTELAHRIIAGAPMKESTVNTRKMSVAGALGVFVTVVLAFLYWEIHFEEIEATLPRSANVHLAKGPVTPSPKESLVDGSAGALRIAQAAYDSGDYEEAFRLLKALAEQGHARAQAKLGYLYGTGRGVGQDEDKAVEWYRKGAQQGDADAQNNLAVMYENARDYPEAVKWYRKLAEQGHAPAQARLGYLYGTGRGLARDHIEALRWFRKAAEHGHAVAQNNLGIFYRDGLGVDSNYAEAAKWFRKAAAQGEISAERNLGVIYEARWDGIQP